MIAGRLSYAGATWGVAISLLVITGLSRSTAHAADIPPLPADNRLAPVRDQLEKILERAVAAGLPANLITDKVREGLAKGVPADAIRGAAERLANNLDSAARFLKRQRPASPASSPSLIRAVAEAQQAGVEFDGLVPLVTSSDSEAVVTRAVEVVTDLTTRGYPNRRSSAVVKEIADRDAPSLGRVVASVETIRSEQTVSRADALEALGRNLQVGSVSLDVAVARTLESGDRAGNAGGSAPGKSGDAPGHTGVSKGKKPKK